MADALKLGNVFRMNAHPTRLSSFFHMVNRIVPLDQTIVSIPPESTVRNAIKLMRKHGYSQLPVIQGKSILGLFTYRAFALEAAAMDGEKIDLLALPVEEFLEHERPFYAQLTDEFNNLVDVLNERDAVLVSGPENLIAILTPMDLLKYLHSVANAFVLVEEIELALRALMRVAIVEEKVFHDSVAIALSGKYEGRKLPQTLEDLSFDDYIAILRDGRNWRHFEGAFGGTRERTRARLEPVRDLRNDIFHFRREHSVEDHERLSTCRDWLLRCVRKVQAKQEFSR